MDQKQPVTIHYHGTPITPQSVLYEMAGRHFCVSHSAPNQARLCHQIGQSVMLDNGAFSAWRKGKPTNWPAYYIWCDQWLDHPTTWAVIPDVIDGPAHDQDALIHDWPHKDRGAPVWHGRMAEVFNKVSQKFSRIPWLHMLRGMSLAGSQYPFASLDSTDIARNHHIPHNGAVKMANRWDTAQCPGKWEARETQMELA